MADNTSPFNQQLSKWWELVSAKDTWDAFKNFFKLIWEIIVETGMLIYLFILGALVSVGWVVDRSSDLTESVKSLQSQANQADDGNLLSEASKSFWSATKQGADNALQTARSTLDIKAPEKKVKQPVAAKPVSKPPAQTPVAAKTETPPPTATPTGDSNDTSSSKSTNDSAAETVRVPDSQEPQES